MAKDEDHYVFKFPNANITEAAFINNLKKSKVKL
jgi:hypothetical protein